MSTYICVECGTVENSAGGGNYWNVRNNLKLFGEIKANEELLCRFCTPKEFDDGSQNKSTVEAILSRPKKRHWSEVASREKILELSQDKTGSYINAKEYFETK